jgi:hypothetical protein
VLCILEYYLKVIFFIFKNKIYLYKDINLNKNKNTVMIKINLNTLSLTFCRHWLIEE